MAAQTQKRQLAVDTNVLFDLADDQDFAHTFREAFQQRGYVIKVPPTVIQELAFACTKGGGTAQTAKRALQQMRSWDLLPFDLISAGHGVTEQFSKKLIDKGYLPDGEFNDGLILAETALANIPMLVTSDGDLLEIDAPSLRVQFEDSDLFPVVVVHPKDLLRALK
jgi:predicted nucleic acid-binding protein